MLARREDEPRPGGVGDGEAELVFGAGLLAGTKLVGFSLWMSPEGRIHATFPSRAFGVGASRSEDRVIVGPLGKLPPAGPGEE